MFNYSNYNDLLKLVENQYEDSFDIVNYDVLNIADVLYECDLIPFYSNYECLDLEKMIFLDGDDSEVYSSDEIKLIESIDKIYGFPSTSKRFKSSTINCKYFYIDLSNDEYCIRSAIGAIKILNKAFSNFNFIVFKTTMGLLVGCTMYSKSDNDVIISVPVECENDVRLLENGFSNLIYTDDFLEYYKGIIDVIKSFKDNEDESFDSKIIVSRGVDYEYLHTLTSLELELGVSFDLEKDRYLNSFINGKRNSDYDEYNEVVDYYKEELKNIKSNKINTFSMLFEAEEFYKASEQNNERINSEIREESHSTDSGFIYEINEELDPIELIKIIKEKKGYKI